MTLHRLSPELSMCFLFITYLFVFTLLFKYKNKVLFIKTPSSSNGFEKNTYYANI